MFVVCLVPQVSFLLRHVNQKGNPKTLSANVNLTINLEQGLRFPKHQQRDKDGFEVAVRKPATSVPGHAESLGHATFVCRHYEPP